MVVDTTFARRFRRQAVPQLMREFKEGEPLEYFKRDGSAARQIDAIVQRDQRSIIAETGEVGTASIIVSVANTTARGFTSEEVDTGGDEIKVAFNIGDTPSRRSIVKILSDSGGMVRVLCQ